MTDLIYPLCITIIFILCRLPTSTAMADGWYIMLRRRQTLQQKTLWPNPEQHLLELYNWYPPLFTVLLLPIPERLLRSIAPYISNIIDFITFSIVFITIGPEPAAIYAVVPTLYTEFRNLNNRALSMLLVVCALLTIKTYFLSGFFVFLLLMQHKLATQLFFPFALVVNPLPTILATIVALLCGYKKVYLGHNDILTFFRRAFIRIRAMDNADGIILNPTAVRVKTPIQNTAYLIAHNPLVLLSPWLINFNYPIMTGFLLWTLALALLTTYVPSLQFLGEGFKYLKYAVLPQLFLMSVVFSPVQMLVIFSLTLACFVIVRLKTSKSYLSEEDENLDAVMQQILTENPNPKIACLPTALCDQIAFKYSQVKVLWGGHGFGFRYLEDFYPIIRRGYLPTILKRYSINYLIYDENFITKTELAKHLKGVDDEFERISVSSGTNVFRLRRK